MSRNPRNCVLLLLLSAGNPQGARAACAEPSETVRPTITVRVYDYAALPQFTANRAHVEASRIFAEAGVPTEWAVCPVSAQTMPGDRKCHVRLSATDIRLNILTAEMARKISKNDSEFGAAFLLPNGFGNFAAIFSHRVREFATRQGASEALLLGHFIAHEIGHLLLGVNSHSQSGLMRVPWDRTQMERAYLGTLLFNKQEAERIQRHVVARAMKSRPEPVTTLPECSSADGGGR